MDYGDPVDYIYGGERIMPCVQGRKGYARCCDLDAHDPRNARGEYTRGIAKREGEDGFALERRIVRVSLCDRRPPTR